MKLAVFSDTHGSTASMVSAVRRLRPDMVVHLGDCTRDTAVLSAEFPQIPLHSVSGNCDFASRESDMELFFAGPVKVFATHGHRYGVKLSLDSLLNSAHFAGARLVLYGHTHSARIDCWGEMTVVNPGAAGAGSRPSFALIEMTDEGAIVPRLVELT